MITKSSGSSSSGSGGAAWKGSSGGGYWNRRETGIKILTKADREKAKAKQAAAGAAGADGGGEAAHVTTIRGGGGGGARDAYPHDIASDMGLTAFAGGARLPVSTAVDAMVVVPDASYKARKEREAAIAARKAREAEESNNGGSSDDDDGATKQRRQFYAEAGVPDPDARSGASDEGVTVPVDGGGMELF
jgi:hypothetical protein